MAVRWEEIAKAHGYAFVHCMLYDWYWIRNLSVACIAERADAWSTSTVTRALHRFGVATKPPGNKGLGKLGRWLTKNNHRVAGMTTEEIAREIGSTRRAVASALTKANIPYNKEDASIVRWRKCPTWRRLSKEGG